MLTTVDVADDILKCLGWSKGEISFFIGYNLTWQVDCRRGDHTIVARGKTQGDAWFAAAQQAKSIEDNDV